MTLPTDRIAEIARLAQAEVDAAAHLASLSGNYSELSAWSAAHHAVVLATKAMMEAMSGPELLALCDEITASRALTHGAHADTARLDWLEKMAHDGERIGDITIDGSWQVQRVTVGLNLFTGDGATVRDAIDAAMTDAQLALVSATTHAAATRSTQGGNQV